MAEAKKDDMFALEKENGSPAYPKMVYVPDPNVDKNIYPDGKYKNGEPVMLELGIVKNPDEHKKLLEQHKQEYSKAPAWSGAKADK